MAQSLGEDEESPAAEIRLDGVTKRFDDVVAVDNVSLSVRPKEFLTLLGPSGAGKTTLLHMVAGFVQPSEGEIWIGDDVVTHKAPYERNIGMVFQSMALFPHRNVKGNIAFPLEMRRYDQDTIDERVEEMLNLVQLPGMEDRRIAELSGGQQQRIAIARALAFEPSLFLLDEPLSSLDKKLREEMRDELKRIHEESGVTTIHVTHNQEEALTMADRIVVLDEGRIEQLSPTQHLYSSPDTSFVADFVGNTNMYDGEVVEAADGSCIVRLDGGLTMMCEHNGFDVGDNVRIALRQEQVSIADEQREIDNLYEGRIVDTTFRGDLISYSVSIDGLSAPIEVSELNDMNHRVYSAGDTIAVGWNATEVYLYAR